MGYLCAFCRVEKQTLFRYCRHLRLYHENLPNFQVTCNIQGCKDTFTVVRCLVRHVHNKHGHVTAHDDTSTDFVDEEVVDDFSDNDNNVAVDTISGSYNGDNMFNVSTLDKTVNDFEKHLILCILKLREKHILPSVVQQDIIDELQLIVSEVHDTYKSIFTAFCEGNNILLPAAGMGRLLGQSTSLFDGVFQNIDSDYKLNKAVHANFAVADPSEFSLGFDSNGKPATFVYISVSSVLQQMLGNDDICHHILSNSNDLFSGDGDTMSSFKDGSVYENHLFFKENCDALRLHFYLDEFEVCNPIGAKRGKHKVLGVYFLVGNLNCKYWSEMKFIHLCILVRYPYVRAVENAYAKVLQPLIDELNLLASEGVNVIVDGTTHNFRAGLATVSGDNLSAHALAGFQMHFNHGRICRFCMANYDEIGTSFREDSFQIRDKTVHAYHLEALDANVDNGPVYGVLSRCPLFDLAYVDVTCTFVPDIMHDLLEGVIPRLLKKVIGKSIRDKMVTVESLNEELLKVSKNVDDRPNLFTVKNFQPNGSIVGSASQKWKLFLLLPQILGKYLDRGDLSWETYLLLRDVTDIVFAPVVRKSILSFLEGLILQFLTLFSEVFGTDALTPKHHYMIHYPRLIGLYGPLRHLWCMRFESKHQYFKSVIASLGNYINVTSTMASRHQMRQCWEFTGNDILSCEACAVGRTQTLKMSQLPSDLRLAIASKLIVSVSVTDDVTSTQQLKVDHVTYKVDGCLIQCVVEEDVPVYLKIKFILHFRSTWLLCGRVCFCQKFDRHLHAHSVIVDDNWAVVYPGEEADYNLHDCFIMDSCNFISSRYYVPIIES